MSSRNKRTIRRKYKLIIIVGLSALIVLFIYFGFKKEKTIIVGIGDYIANGKIVYSYSYNYNDYLVSNFKKEKIIYKTFIEDSLMVNSFLKIIANNQDNINYYLKNANYITICIGSYELYNYKEINETIIINYLNGMYELLNKLRKINSNKIFLINIKDTGNPYISFINQKLKNYSSQNKIIYIDQNSLNDSNYIFEDKVYLNYKGHQKIFNIIKKNL